jgi:formate hydrogenlyase transcriptional activator
MMAEADATLRKYLTLVEVSRVIVSYRDLSELFDALSQCLHRLLTFNYLSVVLHDESTNLMRLHVLHSTAKTPASVRWQFPVGESFSGMVWETQQVLNVRAITAETRFPAVIRLLQDHNVKSFCSLPLTTAHRRIGSLALGRGEEGGYDETDLEFGRLIAAQVAIALDNALHYEESVALQGELKLERDRLQLVLDVSNSVVSNLDLPDMFGALSSSLRRVLTYDSAILLLPDAQDPDVLRVHALDFPNGRGYLQQDTLVPLSSNPGRAFLTGQPLLAGTGPGAVPFMNPNNIRIVGEGLRSSLLMPLQVQGKSVGVVSLASRQEAAFTQADLEFVGRIAPQIAIAVNNALQHRDLSESRERIVEQKSYLEDEIRAEQDFEDIVGSSRALRVVLQQVDTVAPTDSTVLIEGETGTGKELIARAIHDRSSRRDRTFVKINCAAIPLGLLESELFGHEKGAFTGALIRKSGRFELAHHGTLFLDEIGDIPLELQPKLLRVLQEREFERLGSPHTQKVDVRVIAATNQDLGRMVADGKFRGDLFYRLNIFPISLPALRERPEDIPLLARYFTSKYARQMNKHIESITPETLSALTRYQWPGNIRELQNYIERAVILASDGLLRTPVPEAKLNGASPGPSGHQETLHGATLREAERRHIMQALRQSNWVVGGPAGAAARLGVKRTSLIYKMEKLGIQRQSPDHG